MYVIGRQAERDELTAMLSKGKQAARKLKCARILLALQLLVAVSSESMGDHDSGSDDWWRVG